MWVQLTMENEEPFLVDSEKILTVTNHPKGGHLTLTTAVPNKEGKLALKGIIVRENVSQISKLLRPRFAGLRP